MVLNEQLLLHFCSSCVWAQIQQCGLTLLCCHEAKGGRGSQKSNRFWQMGLQWKKPIEAITSHLLQREALSSHLATDMLFPRRVDAYSVSSCYANGAENTICMKEWKRPAAGVTSISPPVTVTTIRRLSGAVSSSSWLFSFRVFFIEKFNFTPAEARAVNR